MPVARITRSDLDQVTIANRRLQRPLRSLQPELLPILLENLNQSHFTRASKRPWTNGDNDTFRSLSKWTGSDDLGQQVVREVIDKEKVCDDHRLGCLKRMDI